MAKFKPDVQALEEMRAKGENVNFPESPGDSLSREEIARQVKSGREGRIHGLIALDGDLERSLSRDPLTDFFALDHTNVPIGNRSYRPRRLLYYVEGLEGRPWKAVFLSSEQRYKEISPNTLEIAEPGGTSRAISIKATKSRAPDLAHFIVELKPETVKFLIEHDFRVLPKAPEELFKQARKSPKILEALAKYPVLPPDAFVGVGKVELRITDPNLRLSVEPGGAWGAHILKNHNTLIAFAAGHMEEFRIIPADGAPVYVVMREVLSTYEGTIVKVVMDDSAGNVMAEFDQQQLLRTGKGGPPNPMLEHVRSTETRITKPYAFYTIAKEGEFDAGIGTFRFKESSLRLPPETTRGAVGDAAEEKPFTYKMRKFTKAQGGQVQATELVEVVAADAYRRTSSLLDDLLAIEVSLGKRFPEEIAEVIRRLRKQK